MDIASLARKLNRKLGKTIHYRQFFDIITIINNYMYEEIINDRPIYIDKLGVITQTVPNSKKTYSRKKNKTVMSKPTKKLVFRPHVAFTRLIQLKRKNLLKPSKK